MASTTESIVEEAWKVVVQEGGGLGLLSGGDEDG